MNKLTASIKKIRLGQIFTAFLAGIFLLIGTACTSTDVLAKTADQIREEVPSGMVTSEFQGGMNDYSDVDPRDPHISAAEAKAQLLKENAQQHISAKSSNNVPENIRRVADEGPNKLNQIGRKLDENSERAQQAAKEFGQNTKEGIANIQDNTRGGLKGAKEIAKEATTGAKNRIQGNTDNLQGAAYQVKEKAENTSDSISAKISRGINDVRRAAENAVDAID
ncbi:MAG: DUF6658 family protein [Actinomycetota bacterium]